MKLLRVGAAALNQTPLAWKENFRNISDTILKAKEEKISILCFPELCLSGYGCEDSFLSPKTSRKAFENLKKIVPLTDNMAVAAGLPILFQNNLFNGAALVVNRKIAGISLKKNIPGDGIYYEQRWFKPWPEGVCEYLEVDNISIPIGDMIFDWGGVKIGFEICEEAWVAGRSGNNLARHGVDIILNPSASHFSFGKHEIRRRFILEGSRAFNSSYIYANLLGNESGRIIFDGSGVVASEGEILKETERFSFRSSRLVNAVIDVDKTRMLQARNSSSVALIGEQTLKTIKCAGEPAYNKGSRPDKKCNQKVLSKEEEFIHAVSLGLFDYMRKSRSRGFVISLSGGADSSATAVLAWFMIKLSLQELGIEGFKEKMGYSLSSMNVTPEDIPFELITCVYQSTNQSSNTTFNAAKAVAKVIKANFINWSIQNIVDSYTEIIEKAISRKTSWESDDIALQNIQARARAPGVWMFANIRNALLLTTSNRSEAAVGYTTMDGDTCGGLSPIGGIDKDFLCRWLEWVEKNRIKEIGPLPELGLVTKQLPTAELRPAEYKQTDEADLMPYKILDQIERLAILDKKYPVEIFGILRDEHRGISSSRIAAWVIRFFRLWCRNQWKRERYAPSFHLDDENLDPKTYCRFPILSGGFADEIDKLEKQYN